MTEDQIKHMVDLFLGWKLPDNFNPDNGISFAPIAGEGGPHPFKREPSGTNLFDATQATAMVRHMIEGLPRSSAGNGDEDLATQLRHTAGHLINGSVEDGEVSMLMLCQAADEIDRLSGQVNIGDNLLDGLNAVIDSLRTELAEHTSAGPQTVLGWLATKTNYELSYSGWDNEDPTWDVHSVNGGRNDREWTLLATGSTPEEALRKAMSLSLSRPHLARGGE